MSNNQDINTNAQTTDDQDAMAPKGIHRNDAPDGEDDVEGHIYNRGRSDQDAMADVMAPKGIHRNDAPDGEDDKTRGYHRG